MFKKINQNRILILVLLLAALTCSLQAASYTLPSPLIVGMENNPFGGTSRSYVSTVIQLTGNFDLIATNATGGWRPGVTPNEDGSPYMDGNSIYTTQQQNILNYGYGTGTFVGNLTSPNWTPATSQYWGTSSGGASGFRFQQNSGGNTATSVVKISILSGIVGTLYWRDTTAPNTLYSILLPTDPLDTVAAFSPTASWEFVYNNGVSNMASTNNGNVAAFAVLQGPPDQGAGVPEPGTFLTMAAGLIALGKLYHRRLGQQSNN